MYFRASAFEFMDLQLTPHWSDAETKCERLDVLMHTGNTALKMCQWGQNDVKRRQKNAKVPVVVRKVPEVLPLLLFTRIWMFCSARNYCLNKKLLPLSLSEHWKQVVSRFVLPVTCPAASRWRNQMYLWSLVVQDKSSFSPSPSAILPINWERWHPQGRTHINEEMTKDKRTVISQRRLRRPTVSELSATWNLLCSQ